MTPFFFILLLAAGYALVESFREWVREFMS